MSSFLPFSDILGIKVVQISRVGLALPICHDSI